MRGKTLDAGALEELSLEWVDRLAGICRVVVNDRADVAAAAGAAGAHLGSDDLPIPAAREGAPRPFLLGASTHGREELLAAQEAGADYAGLGAFFPTSTKPGTRPLDRRGLDGRADDLAIPVLAIGGMNAGRVAEALRVPAVTGVAVSGAIQEAADPREAIGELRRSLEAAWEARERA